MMKYCFFVRTMRYVECNIREFMLDIEKVTKSDLANPDAKPHHVMQLEGGQEESTDDEMVYESV